MSKKGRAMQISGWILDVYEDPMGGLTIWFLNEDGQRQQLHQRFPVTFYAYGQEAQLKALEVFLDQQPAKANCYYERRYDVSARSEIPVLAIEVPSPVELPILFRKIRKRFPYLTYFDVDIPMSLRYTAQTGIYLLCKCQLEVDRNLEVKACFSEETPWQIDPTDLPLRVMVIEPECDPFHRDPRYVVVKVEDQSVRLLFEPARAFLINLQAMLNKHDPDVLITGWGDTWLFPKVFAMAEEQGRTLQFNRDRYEAVRHKKERWYFSYGSLVYRGEQVLLAGRWHVDRKNAVFYEDYQLDGVIETARVTDLPLQVSARVSPGTGISAIQILTALQHGVLVPWQKQQAETPKPAADLFYADQGGMIFQPIVGVHRDVIEVDFTSLYPLAITKNNIDSAALRITGPESLRVPETNLSIDQGRKGVVPMALEPLLSKRLTLKRRASSIPKWDRERRKRDKDRSAALKWLLVCCFGYLGYKNARFGLIEAHQAVTAFAREALLSAKEAAESLGYNLIGAYVDSLTVHQPGKNRLEDAQMLIEEIQWRTGLPIALEGIYRWIVYLPSRLNKNRPVANRYFGVFQDGEIKVRGIAARRRDTAPFIADTQMEMIALLASMENPVDALPAVYQQLKMRLMELRKGRVDPKRLIISQRITRDVSEYNSPPPAARAAAQLLKAGKIVKPGQRVKFLFVLGEAGVCAWDLPGTMNRKTIDLKRYTGLLVWAVEEILQPFENFLKELFAMRQPNELCNGFFLFLLCHRISYPAPQIFKTNAIITCVAVYY